MEQEQLQNLRHSLAHLMAAAVLKLYPNAKRTIGPAVENGFYYDFDFGDVVVTDKDLPKIEKQMKKLMPTFKAFEKQMYTKEQALDFYKDNPYKQELIQEFTKDSNELSFYKSGEYSDLCKGGHADSLTGYDTDAFTVHKLAGAYWRGDEKNKMLTRIYGLAFESKEKLDEYQHMIAEAEKRDHRKLGQQLELFMFHETSPGMPYWLPNGMTIYNELLNFWRDEHRVRGYHEISAPLVNKKQLWETSGHWEHYKNDMFVADMGENETYGIKAMNCPNAMVVFGSRPRSYKDLPLRFSDTDTLHRYELAGTLNGLFRVRSFRQDDSHNFVTIDQIGEEYERIFEITELFYSIFNLSYRFRLGTRPEGFLGDVETWNIAEKNLKDILGKSGKEYFIAEGDGAFYGPKVDILMKDALGREWQMGTIQLDFQQPIRFGLEYTDKDGSKKTPVAIHRVIYGSMERFMGVLIEHYAGSFPMWIAPTQVSVLPISDNQKEYAEKIIKELSVSIPRLRLHLDDRSESIGKKIREATVLKIPYQIIIGQKEVEANMVALRARSGEDLGQMSMQAVIEKFETEIKNKA